MRLVNKIIKQKIKITEEIIKKRTKSKIMFNKT